MGYSLRIQTVRFGDVCNTEQEGPSYIGTPSRHTYYAQRAKAAHWPGVLGAPTAEELR